jgi:alpha,alpha-trehalase
VYAVANVLASLTAAIENQEKYALIHWNQLYEGPVDRLSRLITTSFWNNLTRRLDSSAIAIAALDPKDWNEDSQRRIYIPHSAIAQYDYYKRVSKQMPEINLDVILMPEEISQEVYMGMMKKPGILALEMEERIVDPVTGEKDLVGSPFLVPGGRFNELFYWDSNFAALGLLDTGYVNLVESIVRNFIFEIQNYGLIPNCNRTYCLLRSQPPFLTSLALKVYKRIQDQPHAKEFIRRATLAAIKEYNNIWTSEPRYDPETGLSRYRPKGFGVPLETEKGHFTNVLAPYCQKYDMTEDDFIEEYNDGKIQEPDLDEYFLHDRAVRESGHDVSMRLEGVCADLATIDLNCLIYQYETDISYIIRTIFNDKLTVTAEFCSHGDIPNRIETSSSWDKKALERKTSIDKYLWNEEKNIYMDYNTKSHKQITIESATCFYALWCGVASPDQAAKLVKHSLPKFEMVGGLATSNVDTLPNRGKNMKCHEAHQWDYPSGWAPHQIMAWDGLLRYGYHQDAERICYRWLYSIMKVFVDFNGTVVEKYDVTNPRDPHKVRAEYGNQGINFQGYVKEG